MPESAGTWSLSLMLWSSDAAAVVATQITLSLACAADPKPNDMASIRNRKKAESRRIVGVSNSYRLRCNDGIAGSEIATPVIE